ncbi:MAG: hypothetical protein ACRD2U_02510 [Terriglobales bacterium]
MKKKIQIMLLITVLVAGIRVGYILYERHEDNLHSLNKPQPPPLNPDYYVTPKKLYPYDLKTARQQLMQQPVWVKVGYSITYYPFRRASRRVDFSHEAGLLLPLERLEIKDVILQAAPKSPGQRQLMCVFAQEGKEYAFPVGVAQGDNYHFYVNEMLYIEDPHTLYTNWPADIWDAIDKHEVKPGMSELQADFAVGLGIPEGGGDDDQKTLDYANGGKPIKVTYTNGKATEITNGTSP